MPKARVATPGGSGARPAQSATAQETGVPDLYLAYRHAKTAIFYERRGAGLQALGEFEEAIDTRLRALDRHLARWGWFDGLDIGQLWITPKRLRVVDAPPQDGVIRIGGPMFDRKLPELDVQLRLSPTPEFAIVEVLYLWRFGSALESVLSPQSIGYRLDLRENEVLKEGRWLFEYWPKRYQQFRTAPLRAALREMHRSTEPVTILSADLASFYDTVDPSFLASKAFRTELKLACAEKRIPFDPIEFRTATKSLLRAYARYWKVASDRTGLDWNLGVPIGALTSRVVANVALAELDHWVEASKKTISYHRYVDDLVVVCRAEENESRTAEAVARAMLPTLRRSKADPATVHLDVELLQRPGSAFKLQSGKLCVHQLTGKAGQLFLGSVAKDFAALVSERRAFIDESLILEEVAAKLARSSKDDGSPLRVLRDADRATLKQYTLSTSLRSLERASSMLDTDEARKLAMRTQTKIQQVLVGEGDWVTNLDLEQRILRLAIGTDDAESARQLIARMDRVWGSVGTLKSSVASIHHAGRKLSGASCWVWLRNYLHRRRIETITTALSEQAATVTAALKKERIVEGTGRLGIQALLRRARALAFADLRMYDRETDPIEPPPSVPAEWHRLDVNLRQDAALAERLDQIGSFVTLCRELGDPWSVEPARLFLSTRPPSYFDVARRSLYRVETKGFEPNTFHILVNIVNAIRGTRYWTSNAEFIDEATISVGQPPEDDPMLILGNLRLPKEYWTGAATVHPGSTTGKPILSWERLRELTRVIEAAHRACQKRKSRDRNTPVALLVLPELAVPRAWLRPLAEHIARDGGLSLVTGVEYRHHNNGVVYNQVFAVLPGGFSTVATLPWTKRRPAREEERELRREHGVHFDPVHRERRRTVVHSPHGKFSVLICSELIEASRVADLLGRTELVLVPSWNTDTASYDHLIQSVGLQLHAMVAVANNGEFSDCRAWAPKKHRWSRDLCRLIERESSDVVCVTLPLGSLRAVHDEPEGAESANWRPLPPTWRNP